MHRLLVYIIMRQKKVSFFCSLLCLQETAFVLSRLNVGGNIIEEIVTELLIVKPVNYSPQEYARP